MSVVVSVCSGMGATNLTSSGTTNFRSYTNMHTPFLHVFTSSDEQRIVQIIIAQKGTVSSLDSIVPL